MTDDAAFYKLGDGAVTLTLRATPNASRSAWSKPVPVGEGRVALGVRVAARPVDGAANAALLEFIAREFDVGKRALTLVAGDTGRVKIVRNGGDATGIVERLRGIVAAL